MKSVIIAAALILFAWPAAAQSDYNLRIYPAQTPPATGAITTALLPAPSVLCNQTAPTGVTRNPNKVVFDDPVNAGKACVYTDPGTGPLLGTPTGFVSLEATLTQVGPGGAESDESNRAPFSRTPAALKNVRLVK